MELNETLHLRIEKDIKERLRKVGSDKGFNLTVAVRIAINEFLYRYEKEGKLECILETTKE